MSGTEQMADSRYVDLVEKEIPAWVVQEAVSRAIDEDIRGIDHKNANTYRVMVDRSTDTDTEQ